MAGLQRFITYINKYENDEKMDNSGFAKIEILHLPGIKRIPHIAAAPRNFHATNRNSLYKFLFSGK